MGASTAYDLSGSLGQALAANDRANRYLIDQLSDEAWAAKPPGRGGRTAGGMFVHMHNVRLMWLAAAKAKRLPPKLEPDATREQTTAALDESGAALAQFLETALATGKVTGFRGDAVRFFFYLTAHDAHHRGQAILQARFLGMPVPRQATYDLWREINTR